MEVSFYQLLIANLDQLDTVIGDAMHDCAFNYIFYVYPCPKHATILPTPALSSLLVHTDYVPLKGWKHGNEGLDEWSRVMPRERVVVGGRASCLSTTILSSMLPHRSAAPPLGVPVVKLFAVVKLNGVPYNPGMDTPRFASFDRAFTRDTSEENGTTPPARDGGPLLPAIGLSIPTGDNGGGKGRCARTKAAFVVTGFDWEVNLTIAHFLSPTDLGSLSRSCMTWKGVVYRAVFGRDAKPMSATERKQEEDRTSALTWNAGLQEHAAAQRETQARASRAHFAKRRTKLGYCGAVDEQAREVANCIGTLAQEFKRRAQAMPDWETIDGGSPSEFLTGRRSWRRKGFRRDAPFRIMSEPSPGLYWVMFDEEDCDGKVCDGFDLKDEAACGHVAVEEYRASLAASFISGKHEGGQESSCHGPAGIHNRPPVGEEFPVSQDSINHMIAVDGYTGALPGSGIDKAL